jgi:hypothetical protein
MQLLLTERAAARPDDCVFTSTAGEAKTRFS